MRHLTHFLFFVIIIAVGCKQEKLSPSLSDLLINEKGWDSYEYKRADIGLDEEFVAGNPYLVFQQYGSGCKFLSNGDVFTGYLFESDEIEESGPKGTWKLFGKNELQIDYFGEHSFHVQIVSINKDSLWFKYEDKGQLYELKMRAL